MQCNEIKLLLPDWVKEKEHNTSHIIIQQHLMTCQNCTNEAEAMEQLFSRIDNDKQYVPTQQYFTNLLPHIHQRIERKRKQKYYWRIFQIATPVVALFVLFFISPKFSSEQTFTIENAVEGIIQSSDTDELRDFASTMLTEDYSLPVLQHHDILSQEDKNVVEALVAENPQNAQRYLRSLESDDAPSLLQCTDEEAEQIALQLEKNFSPQ
ncbi:MAG: hypothetical protein KGZ58_01910 [Ignavibacteriales bacterium]|nr:hypothetical protein [Ignavibacteriales bacterium]